jgi:hypothetical protein
MAWNLQLICSGCSNGIYCCLIICKNEVRVHVMGLDGISYSLTNLENSRGEVRNLYLIHKSKNNLFIRLESVGKFAPERSKLSGGSCR